MAAGFNVAEKNLEDLEKEVTCAICQEHYRDPKILPCLHYYCKECILRLALKSGKDKPFSCPECRKNTTLPEGGVEELKSAFLINRLKSMYFKHKKTLSKQAQCEMCKSEPLAEAFCKQCDKFACKNCAQMHTEMVAFFEGHEIVPIDKLHEVKTEELVSKSSTPKKKCQVHGKTLKIFCFDCSKPICRDCTVKDHKDHNIEFNNVAAGNKKKELMESLKPLREVEDSLNQALDKVHNAECEVEGQENSVANAIETSFVELHTILETRKQQLMEDAKRKIREKIENLKGQEKNLSIASAGVRSVIDYTEQCVRHCSDEEVMSTHIEISRRIQEEIEGHSKPENKLEPVEEADMVVEASCAEDLQQLCQKVKIAHLIDYIMVNNMPSTAKVSQKIKFEIVNTNKKAIKCRLNLQGQVKCLPTGVVIKPEVEVKTPDRYEMSYTPSVCGHHEVSISMYGQPIHGSPFTVNVSLLQPELLQAKFPFEEEVQKKGKKPKKWSVKKNETEDEVFLQQHQKIEDLDVFSQRHQFVRSPPRGTQRDAHDSVSSGKNWW